ncbi:unnamed protein product [Lupinus luteus]|uniref:VQ domain-containing protein n=1 Tax=Lupinus luteus TaxID=3873 RepID=A0AAV1Y1R6_LUPLU
MQSSSACGEGDEEYDLHVESSFSTLLDKASPPSLLQPKHVVGSMNNLNSHMLDPLSNYLGPIQRSEQNFETEWSKVVRSEPNQSDLASFMASSIPSSSSHNEQASLSSLGHATFATTHHSSMAPPHESALFSEDQAHNHNKNMVRNPKKRSRASRRAPTTVLTTNTTNFRAMVQEFTGIPAQPLSSSLAFERTRLDIFGSSSSTIRSLDTTQPTQPQSSYLLHPFPPSSSISSIPISMLDSNNNNTLLGSNHSTSNPPSNPPQFMMNNMHNNPILSFQTILQGQQNTKYPLGNYSKTQPALEIPNTSVDNSHLKMSVFEELGLNHAHVNNMISSSSVAALSSRVNNNNMGNNPSPLEWVQRTGTTLISSNNNNDGGDNHANYTSNNLHGEKGPECSISARSEGFGFELLFEIIIHQIKYKMCNVYCITQTDSMV